MMEDGNVAELFEKASKIIELNDSDVKKARQYDGILAFKKAVLGRWPWKKEKVLSLDALAQVFVNIGMASDEREGKSIVFQLENVNLYYGDFKYLKVDRTEKGIYEYKIRVCRF